MKKQLWIAPLACVLSLAARSPQPLIAQDGSDSVSAQAEDKVTYTIFDAPDSCVFRGEVNGSPIGMDAQGTVVGTYEYCNTAISRAAVYSFYRLSDGTIHEFHPDPKVTTYGAVSTGVNAAGIITGWFEPPGETNPTGLYLVGFLRDRSGNYTTFRPFDSVFTTPEAINSAGTVTGEYQTSEFDYHGFVRDVEGNYTSFDAPDTLTTFPTSINSSGAIVGYTNLGPPALSGSYPGFLRESDGHIIALAPEHSMSVYPVVITDDGAIVGYYYTDSTHISGFIRDPQGHYTTINAPIAGAIQTIPTAVNPNGTIVGYYLTSPSAAAKAFYRHPDGTFGFFAPPGAATTVPTVITPQGTILGSFLESAGYSHYFIRPDPNPPASSTVRNKDNGAEPAQ